MKRADAKTTKRKKLGKKKRQKTKERGAGDSRSKEKQDALSL